MRTLRSFCVRIAGLFRRTQHDAELTAELESHLTMHIEDNLRAGMTPEDARRAALIRLGGVEQAKEKYRAQRTIPWVDALLRDIRFGMRMLGKNPGFAAVAVLTLALGIGANTAIFSVTYSILLKPLPFSHPSRIVQIWERNGRMQRNGVYVSERDFESIQRQDRSFAQIGSYLENGCCAIIGDSGPTPVQGARVSGNFFSVLGVQPLLGRAILPQDDQAGHETVAVISYALWKGYFGGDPQIVGKRISLSRDSFGGKPVEPYTIVGVLPEVFPFPNLGKIYVPDAAWDKEIQRIGIARLKDAVSLSHANAELQTIAAGLQAQYPKADAGLNLSASTLRDRITEFSRTELLVLFAAMGFVLLLACVNVGNLLIARWWARHGEISVRHTLGATRRRLLRQLLTESALLSLCGGLLGLPFAYWGVSIFRAIAPPGTPRLGEIALDSHVFAYALLVSLLSGLLFGIAPALLVTGTGPLAGLKEIRAGSFGTSVSRNPRVLRNVLIVAEISLAFLLVTGASLTARSLLRLSTVDMGFQRDNIIQMWVSFTRATCSSPEACTNTQNEVLERLYSTPGVESAAFGIWQPLTSTFRSRFQIRGRSEPEVAQYQAVTPRYFDVLGIPLLRGRAFGDGDTSSSSPVVIVNAALAKAFFNGDAIGRQIGIGKDKDGNPIWSDVVGEVGDTRDSSPKRAPAPAYYVPYAQAAQGAMGEHSLIVRTASEPIALLPAIRQQVWAVDKNAPILGAESIKEVIAEKTAEPRFQTSVLGAFGILALLLSIVGVYGVTSYSLSQRTHEMGVRIALGARPSDVIQLVVGENLKLALAGIVAGFVASWALTRFLRSMLFEIKPMDPVTLAAVAIVLFSVALLACWIPAHRATRVDPMTALRCE